MTVIFMESFDGVSTIAQLAGAAANDAVTKWFSAAIPATNFSLDATGGPAGGQSLKAIGGSGVSQAIIHSLGSRTVLYIGAWWKPASIAAGTNYVLGVDDSSNYFQVARTGSELRAYDNVGAIGAATVGLGLVAGTYYPLEISLVFTSGTTWDWTVRVNGVQVLSGTTNLNTAAFTRVLLGSVTGSLGFTQNDEWAWVYMDDAAFLTGGGSWQVQCIRPDGAGAHTDWVPDSGANWSEVNEQNVNDASYVQATFDGEEDTYTYANPTPVSGHAVRAIQVNSRAAYLLGAKNLAHVIRNGTGTEGQGADKALAASLGWVGTVFNKQADGTTDWGSFVDLDSYQVGRKQRA